MGNGRKPGELESPFNKDGSQKRKAEIKSTLKGNWNMVAMSFEDTVREFEKKKWIIYIAVLIFPVSVILMLPIMYFSKGMLGVTIGLTMLTIFIGIAIFIGFYARKRIKMMMDPDVNRETKASWKDVSRNKALGALKDYVEGTGRGFRFEEYTGYRKMGWKKPEHRYHLENGIIIKGMHQKMRNTIGGWIAIEYPCDLWEDALVVQIELDRYLDSNGVLYKDPRRKKEGKR